MIKYRKQLGAILLPVFLTSSLLSGCNTAADSQAETSALVDKDTAEASDSTNSSQTESLSASDGAQDSTTSVTAASVVTDAKNLTLKTITYDKEDLDDTWDEDKAVIITLDKTTATASKTQGVTITDNLITINAAGTYVLTGTLTDGQVLINASKEDTVHLVLNNADISCSTSSAIYAAQSDKLILTLADGTTNTLTDAASYIYEDSAEDEPNAALFSKDDLIINGSGSLKVTGNYQDGIRTKDDLTIISGTLDVTAAEDGIKGKDSVTVKDGNVTVNAQNDGIKSSNNTDVEKGYICIGEGTFDITSGNDGIQAETLLQVTGGTFDLKTGGTSTNAKQHTTSDFPGGKGGGTGGGGGGFKRGNHSSPDGTTQSESTADDAQTPETTTNDNSSSNTIASTPSSQTEPLMHYVSQSGTTDTAKNNEESETAKETTAQTSKASATTPDSNTADSNTKDNASTDASGTDTAATESTSSKGLKAGSGIYLTGGTYNIDSADDSIHTNGSVHIAGGNFSINTGDDGVHADYALLISDGTVNILKSYEGLEGTTIDITGGDIHAAASDDGLNAAGGNDSSSTGGQFGNDMFAVDTDAYIRISGGTLYVNADGDGIDSNGNLYIDGGTTLVCGPTSGGDGALDFNGTGEITGGILLAAGSNGMAQSLSESSTQASVLVGYDELQKAGTLMNLTDSSGTPIASFAPSKDYQSVIISTPDMETGAAYTLYSAGSAEGTAVDGYYGTSAYTPGTKISDITLESVVTTSGSVQSMGGMNGGGMKGGGGRGERPDMDGTAPQDGGTPPEMPDGSTTPPDGGTPPDGIPENSENTEKEGTTESTQENDSSADTSKA